MRATRYAGVWLVMLAAGSGLGCSAAAPEASPGTTFQAPPPATPDQAVVTVDPHELHGSGARPEYGTIYAVGGTVTGLSGSVTLHLAGHGDVVVEADGAFSFPSLLADDAEYAVTVAAQPATQVCTVAAGAGRIPRDNVTNILVTCVTGFAIGGSVVAANGSLVLQNGEGTPFTVSGNGPFVFPARVVSGTILDVHVVRPPAGRACAVIAHSSGVVMASITDIAVRCFTPFASCKTLHESLATAPSGVYPITPAGTTFDAYCDMVRDGGGWTRAINIRPDSNFQGDRPEAFGDVSKDVSLAKLDDALITSMSTLGYFRFDCGSFNGYVRTAEATWSSARSNSLTWSVDPSRTGNFSCAASRDGYGFSSADGTGEPVRPRGRRVRVVGRRERGRRLLSGRRGLVPDRKSLGEVSARRRLFGRAFELAKAIVVCFELRLHRVQRLGMRPHRVREQAELPLHRIEAPIRELEALVHPIEALVHRIEAFVHRLKALIDRIEAPLHMLA